MRAIFSVTLTARHSKNRKTACPNRPVINVAGKFFQLFIKDNVIFEDERWARQSPRLVHDFQMAEQAPKAPGVWTRLPGEPISIQRKIAR